MKIYRKYLVIGIIVLFVGASSVSSITGNIKEIFDIGDIGKSEQENAQSERILERFDSVSMFFTENKGQFPSEVLFQTHVPGATVYLCKNK